MRNTYIFATIHHRRHNHHHMSRYGNVDLELNDNETLVMVAGGIGVTPVVALLTALHSGVMHPGRLSDVYFYWSFRDVSTLECFAREVAEVAASSEIPKPGKALYVAPSHHCLYHFCLLIVCCRFSTAFSTSHGLKY